MLTLRAGTITAIHDFCYYRAPALILDPESGSAWRARFAFLSEKSFTLQMLEDTRQFLKTSRLFISFAYDGNPCVFFTTVLEYQENAPLSSPLLTLQLPTKIIGLETRMSYRVPIGKRVVPLVHLSRGDNRILHPKPVDLSLTGIMVEFDGTEDTDLLMLEEIRLELRLDAEVVHLKCVVKRRDGHCYGLFFPEVVTKHGVCPPQSLRKIVESLELAMLQDRARPTGRMGDGPNEKPGSLRATRH